MLKLDGGQRPVPDGNIVQLSPEGLIRLKNAIRGRLALSYDQSVLRYFYGIRIIGRHGPREQSVDIKSYCILFSGDRYGMPV